MTKRKPLVRRACAECGSQFVARNSRHLTCGPSCSQERRRRRENEGQRRRYVPLHVRRECECEGCGAVFMLRQSGKPARFCDHACAERTWRVRNAETQPARERRQTLRRHGIDEGIFQAMLARQGGKCANEGCGRSEPGGRHGTWHIDHDHACCPGRGSCGSCVRGLLCDGCNRAAGCARDSAAVLAGLAAYLKQHRQLRLAAV